MPLKQEARNGHGDVDMDEEEEQEIQMVDIVRAKMIFKQRPLPIM